MMYTYIYNALPSAFTVILFVSFMYYVVVNAMNTYADKKLISTLRATHVNNMLVIKKYKCTQEADKESLKLCEDIISRLIKEREQNNRWKSVADKRDFFKGVTEYLSAAKN